MLPLSTATVNITDTQNDSMKFEITSGPPICAWHMIASSPGMSQTHPV